MTASQTIVIRHSNTADAETLDRLAILDSRGPFTGPALIAEVDGVARAARDLHDGSVAADPFFPSATLVDLLAVHARPQRPRRMRAFAMMRLRATHA